MCEELEAKVEQLRQQKKASVRPNPNEKFVNIEQIMEVKAKLERKLKLVNKALRTGKEITALIGQRIS